MLTKVRVALHQHENRAKKIIVTILLLLTLVYLLHPQRFASNNFEYVSESDIINELDLAPLAAKEAALRNQPLCHVTQQFEEDELLYPTEPYLMAHGTTMHVHSGGTWEPKECVSQHQTAIIVPYRNRSTHLDLFLRYMHPFLQKQMLNYRIVIVEQTVKEPFNRAKLFNIGFKEVLKIFPYHCFIFHDVDLIPQKLSNIYGCTHEPRHMSSSLNTFRYNLPYRSLFGGVVSITRAQFELVNGFSNLFYGWGGEDDDFQDRVNKKGIKICRFAPHVARYFMLTHNKELPNKNRYENLIAGRERFETDGINSLRYTVLNITNQALYTWILVDL